ncbi:g1563 [Coccomyxa elongata]
MDSDSESDGEERGGSLVGFLFGNVDKDMQLEDDYMDEDARESLFALGDEKLGGDVLKLKGDASHGDGDAKTGDKLGKDADAKNYSDEEELAEDPSDLGLSRLPAGLPLPLAIPLPGPPAEEDDYDADTDDYDAAPSTAPPTVLASTLPPPQPPIFAANVPASAQTALVLALPSLPMLQAGAPGEARVTPAQLQRMLSLPDDDIPLHTSEAAPSDAAAAPQPVSAVAAQLEKARAVGVELPVLADMGTTAVLRFSELFGNDEDESQSPAAHQPKPRQPRQASQPSAVATSAEEEDASGDEAALLFAGEPAEVEADVWASEADEAGPSDKEDGEEEEGTAQAAHQQDKQQGDPLAEDEAPAARPPPGWRRAKRVQGGEPLLMDKDARSGYVDPEDALAALPVACFDPVCQLDWERTIVWEHGAGSVGSALAQMTHLNLAEEEEDVESEAEVLSAAASPAHLPAPPPTDGDIIMLTEEPPSATVAVAPDQAATSVNVPAPEGVSSVPDQAATPALPDPSSVAHQAPMPDRPAEGRSLAPAAVEEMWVGVDPDARLEELSVANSSDHDQRPVRHHQMLRLEGTLAQVPDQAITAAEGLEAAPVSVAPPLQLAELATNWARQAVVPNQRLQVGTWLGDVAWDADVARLIRQPLLLDLNDRSLTFELRRGADASLVANAAAMILPPRPKVVPVLAAVQEKGEAARLLARYNVSKDAAYSAHARKKGDRAQVQVCKHSTPAASLLTLPIRQPSRHDTMHRPVSTFVPAPAPVHIKLKVEVERSQVKISSLVGKDGIVQSFKDISLAGTTTADLWAQAKAGKFADAADLQPVFWLRGQEPRILPTDVSLRQAGAPANVSIDLAVTFPRLRPLPHANRVPDPSSGVPTRPPGAFTKKQDLTAVEGHIVLLEYLEEKPLLLSRPGMGVRLTTYYRKRSATDNADLQKLVNEKERWRSGHVEVLSPEDDSPFLLGDIAPGAARLAIDTNMFRAVAFPYAARPTDFLVIRSRSGALSLRQLSGTIIAGQQEPNMVVPVPRSKEARDIEENRLVAHVCRVLRIRQSKLDKGRSGGGGGGRGGAAGITLDELRADFPVSTMSDAVLQNRLRERCGCQPRGGEDGGGEMWVLRPGARIPVEGELRKIITPDAWCTHESMKRGILHLKDAGLGTQAVLAQVPQDRLRLMFEALPPSPEREAAFEALVVAVQSTPWALTENFVAAMREGRGRLAITGPGDPTGHGVGFSFFRDDHKAAADSGPVPKREVGQITGTNSDLRRLSMEKSREILLSLGITDDEIKGLSRWHRIALVRELSSAAMMDGASALGARYARAQRQSAVELQQQSMAKAQAIFAAQAKLLGGAKENEAPPGEGSGSDDDAEPGPAAANGKLKAKKGAGPKAKAAAAAAIAPAAPATEALRKMTEEAEEAKELADMRKAGLLSARGAAGATPAGKLEAAPGARRIRRTITITNPEDGSQTTREIIYTDRDKVALLNSMYGDGNAGFCRRVIKAGTGKRALLEGGGPPLLAGTKSRKGGARKSTIQCKACGQTGHNSKNKLCPLYAVTHGQAAAEEDYEEDAPRSPGKRPSLTLRFGSGMLMSPSSMATSAADSDADEEAPEDGGRKRRRLSEVSLQQEAPVRAQAVESGGNGGGPKKMLLAPPKPSPEKPEPPPRRRLVPKKAAGQVSARKALCQRLLTPVLSAVKRRCGKMLDPFRRPVQKTLAPDYNDFVDESEEMNLETMERKLKSALYGSSKEFTADINRIVRNATAYNTPGHGRYGGPDIIQWAQQMRNFVREELADIAEKIEHADALVALEDAGGNAQDDDADEDGGDAAADGAPEAAAAASAGAADSELWVQCTNCQKWRRLSRAVYDATVSANDDDPWYCHQNFDRPGASCEQPADEEGD